MTTAATAEPRELPRVGETLGERFELRRVLGEGGMGQVYLARDRHSGREVALKLLIPRYVGRAEREMRFLREAELGQRATHGHLVEYIGAGRFDHDGWPFIVMERIEGNDLGIRLAGGALSSRLATRVARQVAGALRALHHAGVVHRDVTAMNVLMDGEDATLIDLSHAGDLRLPRVPVGDPGRITRLNEVPGTHHYMSKEQANAAPADPAMDVYAFGVTMIHMLTGRAPRGYGREEYIAMQRRGLVKAARLDPRVYSRVPMPLVELANACVDEEAQRRPTVDDIVEALDEISAVMVMPVAEATKPVVAANGQTELSPAAAPVGVSEQPIVARPSRGEVVERPRVSIDAAAVATVDGGGEKTGEPRASSRSRLWAWVFVAMAGLLLVLLATALMLWSQLSKERDDRGQRGQAEAASMRVEPTQVEQPDAAESMTADEPRDAPAGAPSPPSKQAPRDASPGREPVDTASPVAEQVREAPVEKHGGAARPRRGTKKRSPKAGPEPKPEPGPHNAEPVAKKTDCTDVPDKATAASRRRDWKTVLALTRTATCWPEGSARDRLRASALLKMGRYAQCAAMSTSSNAEARRLARSCADALKKDSQ